MYSFFIYYFFQPAAPGVRIRTPAERKLLPVRRIVGYVYQTDQALVYSCSVCGVDFPEATELVEHMVTHEKPPTEQLGEAIPVPQMANDGLFTSTKTH